MKRLLMLLMAFCLVIPTMNAQNKVLEKARQKEYKTKMKQFKKEKWQVFGTSRSLDVALLAHYDKLNTLGDEAQELLYGLDAFLLILCSEMCYAALGCVDGCSAEFLLGDFFSGDALHHGGAGEEHVGGILYHEGEVRKGGGIHRTACAGAENAANLWDHAGGKDISLEDLSEACKGVDSFLDAGSAGIVKADAGGSVTCCQVHDLADLFAHGL